MNHNSRVFNKREQALSEILQIAGLGRWEIGTEDESPQFRFDAAAAAILGLGGRSRGLSIPALLNLCHEADRSRVEGSLAKLMSAPGLSESVEHRVLNGEDNQWRWIRSFAKSYREPSGKIHVMGCTQEIHGAYALKSIIDQVSAAKERVQIMLDATPLCCNFWDENFNNIDCNQEAVNLFELKSKQEYLDKFYLLSPECQPDGQLSSEKAKKMIQAAFESGKVVFEWLHQKLDGTPISAEITLVRARQLDKYVVAGFTRDLRDYKKMIAEMREADERAQIMLDATPLCCNFWDENFNNIDCNQEAVNLFDLKSKQEYLDRFFELSPEHQPDGQLSSEKAAGLVQEAFKNGRAVFEWLHCKLNGEKIPTEITLVRVKRGENFIVVGYTRDLREYKRMMADINEANERTQIMLDATPLCCNFWDENYNNIDCNQEAANLFDLKSKQEYLDNFYQLSPEYQPDGRLSSEKSAEMIKQAFTGGRVTFEWMHQKLNGEPIPSEITLVRVKRGHGYIVLGYTRDLREYMKMMADMREADERAKIMLDATPLCCNLWDSDFNNIDCNEEAVKLFGLKDKQEYLDRFFELSPEYQPDGRLSSEKAVGMITKAFKDGRVTFEWMHQMLNGDEVPSEITLVRVKRGEEYIVAGYTRDLREYKRMMAEMREADERTKIMLDATPLCCNLWDSAFNNIDCNEEAVKLFELRDKQEYLERFQELSPKYQPDGQPSSEKSREMITAAFQTGDAVFEWMHQKLNGEPVPAEITLVRVRRGDEYIVAGYTRDLREYKKMMGEIKQVESDLRLARDAAEQSAKSKSEFLANMSHEIRTPMNAILGMLNLVQAEDMSALSERQADYIQKAEQSTKTLLRIINDILDFSKIEAGHLEMEDVGFSISSILQQMKDIFGSTARDKNLRLEVNAAPGLPDKLRGDPLRLAQILLNLVGNSVKFTDQGVISLSVAELSRRDMRVRLKFTVKDSGIGMTAEQTKRLFSPFTQADTSTTRKYGGTGLGLAISKKLANMMGGEIWCTSKPDVGTNFFVTAEFKLLDEKEQIPSEGALKSGHNRANGLRNRNVGVLKPILLTEDNEINQIIAQKLLEKQGYKVDVANNGQEAIEMLLNGDYGLVLMDIQMPVMDGLTATRKIRELERFKNLPIIAMTAHAMSGDREKSLEAGMNDHVTKPIDMKMLYETLERWLAV